MSYPVVYYCHGWGVMSWPFWPKDFSLETMGPQLLSSKLYTGLMAAMGHGHVAHGGTVRRI